MIKRDGYLINCIILCKLLLVYREKFLKNAYLIFDENPITI